MGLESNQEVKSRSEAGVSPTSGLSRWAATLLLLVLSLGRAAAFAGDGTTSADSATQDDLLVLPKTQMADDSRAIHVMNRLAFGSRPGDLSRVLRMGLETYIQQQLRPEAIHDPELTRRLEPLTSLTMTTPERLISYPPRTLVLTVARNFKKEITPEQRAELLPEILPDEPRENRADKKIAKKSDPRKLAISKEARQAAPGPRVLSEELAQSKLIRAIYGKRQLEEVMTDFWFNHFNVYVGKGAVRWWATDYEQTAIRPHAMGNFRDLLGAVARHPAMLFYLDNWLSSSAEGGGVDWMTMRVHAIDGMREHGLPPGGLATLLVRERGLDTTELERRIARQDARLRMNRRSRGREASSSSSMLPGRTGVNENYARELLELHTLGVDGGYSQDDIVEVARAFTGWTLLPLPAGQTFVFVPALHDRGPKTVLGTQIAPEGDGRNEGEAVLDLLARHPATARFISTKLARRFVSDDPPRALIERMAHTFTTSDGDIRQVLRTLLTSPEFWSPDAFGAKIKTPFEFVVSAARATAAEVGVDGAQDMRSSSSPPGEEPTQSLSSMSMSMTGADTKQDVRGAKTLMRTLYRMGQPLYGCQPPTGYKDTEDTWISAGALLHRMKVAMGMTSNRLRGVETDVAAGFSERSLDEEAIRALAWSLTGTVPTPESLRVIHEQLELTPEQLKELNLPARFGRTSQGPVRIAAGWILASPGFQRR